MHRFSDENINYSLIFWTKSSSALDFIGFLMRQPRFLYPVRACDRISENADLWGLEGEENEEDCD